ncbi:MAG TPA: class I SAM-dependent methyltransferase [Candidatus Binatia bacterium]|nr:class I SAM-dependent methyltransferase [Candidatus Binatia bacterium]
MTREEIRLFYDRFGTRQDRQGFYEDAATRDLVAHAGFEEARTVFEFGCGTGRFAAGLLAHQLPEGAVYTAYDVSSTMVELARRRLMPFGHRVHVQLTDGSVRLDMPDTTFDRFVSNYVLDLLPAEDIVLLVQEAHRVLTPDGRLCLVSLTHGTTSISRLVSRVWTRVHGRRPNWVGGCRPIGLRDFIQDRLFQVEYRNVVVARGIPSEILIARKRPSVG